jgi:hypothetical protein
MYQGNKNFKRYECGFFGHTKTLCPKNYNRNQINCHRCGSIRHKRIDCPKEKEIKERKPI